MKYRPIRRWRRLLLFIIIPVPVGVSASSLSRERYDEDQSDSYRFRSFITFSPHVKPSRGGGVNWNVGIGLYKCGAWRQWYTVYVQDSVSRFERHSSCRGSLNSRRNRWFWLRSCNTKMERKERCRSSGQVHNWIEWWCQFAMSVFQNRKKCQNKHGENCSIVCLSC